MICFCWFFSFDYRPHFPTSSRLSFFKFCANAVDKSSGGWGRSFFRSSVGLGQGSHFSSFSSALVSNVFRGQEPAEVGRSPSGPGSCASSLWHVSELITEIKLLQLVALHVSDCGLESLRGRRRRESPWACWNLRQGPSWSWGLAEFPGHCMAGEAIHFLFLKVTSVAVWCVCLSPPLYAFVTCKCDYVSWWFYLLKNGVIMIFNFFTHKYILDILPHQYI